MSLYSFPLLVNAGLVPVPASYTYPLDVQNGSAAFGLSLLRSAYGGQCLRVRRSSDNTEQDIGFSGYALDTASLLSFCGAGNGFIRTWYDQTGNGRDMTNSNGDVSQPQIVTSGALSVTLGGHAALQLSNANGCLLVSAGVATNFVSNSEGTVFTVFSTSSLGHSSANSYQNEGVWGDNGGWVGSYLKSTPAMQQFCWDSAERHTDLTIATSTAYAQAWQHTGGNVKAYLNSQTVGASAACGNSGMTSSVMRLGNTGQGGGAMNGALAAVLFYSASVSAGNLNSIGAALASYYGVTWT